MLRLLSVGLLLITLTGCAGVAARAIQHAAYLDTVASEFVREIHDFRRWIREQCKASLTREIDKLRTLNDEPGLRKLLSANYPKPITFELIKAIKDGDITDILISSGCTEVNEVNL